MATVHIWDNKEHTGHCSIAIAGDYISFHPNLSHDRSLSNDEIFEYNQRQHVNLVDIADHTFPSAFTSENQDHERYGFPMNTVELHNLDEDFVGEYLVSSGGHPSHFDQDHQNYCLRSCNCSTVVAGLLLLGKHQYADDSSFITTAITKMRHLNKITYDDSHHTARDYHDRRYEHLADQLEQKLPMAYMAARRTRGRAGMIASSFVMALDFARRAMVWTPGDVLHLALHIREHD